MAISNAVCTSYKNEILQGVHLLADVYKIALYTNAATMDATNTVYTVTNEVAATGGYTAGGVALGTPVTGTLGNFAYMQLPNTAIASATITARGFMIYNSTRSNKAVMVGNFGASDITSTGGTFTIFTGNASTSAATITFSTAPNLITRSAGSFITDGYVVGQSVITDSTVNPGPFTITAVSALSLTVSQTPTAQGPLTVTVKDVVLIF
jgi:hypothetical protein